MLPGKNSKIMQLLLICVMATQVLAEAGQALSLLDMLPEMTAAFEDFKVHHAKNRRRRLQASSDEPTDLNSDFNDFVDNDDEEIIDPDQELPDGWEDSSESG